MKKVFLGFFVITQFFFVDCINARSEDSFLDRYSALKNEYKKHLSKKNIHLSKEKKAAFFSSKKFQDFIKKEVENENNGFGSRVTPLYEISSLKKSEITSDLTRVFEELIENGMDVDFFAQENQNVSFLAFKNGHANLVGILCKHYKNVYTESDLLRAVNKGDVAMVNVLLKHGNYSAVKNNGFGFIPFDQVLKRYNSDMIDVFFYNGFNPNMEYLGSSLLAYILEQMALATDEGEVLGFRDVAEVAIKSGANVFADDVLRQLQNLVLLNPDKHTVVLNLVNYIVKSKLTDQEVRDHGFMFLQLAVALRDKSLINFLVNEGIDVALVNDTGSILHAIVYGVDNKKTLDFIKFLMTLGVDVNAVDVDGSTALHALLGFKAPNKYTLQHVDYLLQNGANIKAHDNEGNTVLHHLLSNCSINEYTLSLLKFLIRNGANVHAKNGKGENIVHALLKQCSSQKEIASIVHRNEVLDFLSYYLDFNFVPPKSPVKDFRKNLKKPHSSRSKWGYEAKH